MISVIIPTLNAEAGLPATLSALVPAALDGFVLDVTIVDGGSHDATLQIAEASGATLITAAANRGAQLAAGAPSGRGAWLLFLHADTVLEAGWERDARAFMLDAKADRSTPRAAAFRFALEDAGLAPRLVAWGVAARCALLRLPYGDQGLLISRADYRAIGGHRPMPLFEDVDIVRRLGGRVSVLGARAVTSAARYRRDGYAARVLKNLWCTVLYRLGVPPERIARRYG